MQRVRRPPPRRRRRRPRDSAGPAEIATAIAIVIGFLIFANQSWGPWVDFGALIPETADSVADASAGPPAGESPGDPPRDAKAIVEKAVAIAAPYGTYVCSSYRPGETLAGGGLSDHAGNDANRAARDISVPGIDCLHGPPQPNLDQAAVAIGKYFGRTYGLGAVVDADTFAWHGHRIQIIYRTPKYGDHRGHIHIGACQACPV
jgi:hypothetical protein